MAKFRSPNHSLFDMFEGHINTVGNVAQAPPIRRTVIRCTFSFKKKVQGGAEYLSCAKFQRYTTVKNV